MENGWIKLYRKLLQNDILTDERALQVFIWLLLKVDRDTGIKKVARSWACQELAMKPTTFYDALHRLVKKYKMATAQPTAKYTIISLNNWTKYQDTDRLPDISPTSHRQQPDTLQEVRSKNKDNTHGDKPRDPPVAIRQWKRPPIEHQTVIQRIGFHYEDVCHTHIVNWGKQAKAIASMLQAGYTEDQITRCISYMAQKESFFRDKGFDLMTVANQITRLQAEERTFYG